MDTTLPMIIRFEGVHDFGPADPRPNGICPHCGAEGRYVYTFECEDGSERGAMRGCLSLYPVSDIAKIDRKLREREMDLRKRYGREAHLNRFEQQMRDALDSYYDGDITKAEALAIVRNLQVEQRQWREAKR